MEQLSVLQAQKLEAEESLAGQLVATKEELMTAKMNCERLKKELAIANDRLSKFGVMKRNGALCYFFFVECSYARCHTAGPTGREEGKGRDNHKQTIN